MKYYEIIKTSMIQHTIMGKCVRCSTIFDPDTKWYYICRKCHCYNFEVEPWSKVPEQIKKEVIADFSKKPIREKIGESELDVLVKDSLKVCKYESEYNLIETYDYDNLSSSESTENGFDLYYNPELLRKFNDDEIKAIIRHEIFHPITIGLIKFPEESFDNQNLFLKIYAEMINHKKHVNQIPNDIELRKIKQKISYEAIGTLLIVKDEINYIHDGYHISERILRKVFKSLELLIYYFYDDTKTIMPLIKKYDLQAIWELFSWVNHDMSHIQKNFIMKGDRLEDEDIPEIMSDLSLICALAMQLNFEKLFLENKIEFTGKVTSTDFFKQEAGTPEAKKILEFWHERVLQNT
jgi:hypothetical protein